MTPPLAQVRWDRTYRLIRSIYPPDDLFEDIADPADWEALASAEAKTNPRVFDTILFIDLGEGPHLFCGSKERKLFQICNGGRTYVTSPDPLTD